MPGIRVGFASNAPSERNRRRRNAGLPGRRGGKGRKDVDSTIQTRGQGPAGVRRGDGSHGDAVIDALTAPTRLMIAAVLIINLSLGFWLVRSSDFTEVQPQGANLEALEPQALGEGGDSMSLKHASQKPSIVALGESTHTSN